MDLQNVLGNVDKKWHKDFLEFIDTGEAKDEFLDYLNNDAQGQKAVEMAFTAQSNAIQGLAEQMRNASAAPHAVPDHTEAASSNLAWAVENVLRLKPEQRQQAVKEAASTLVSVDNPGRQREVADIAAAFMDNLGREAMK